MEKVNPNELSVGMKVHIITSDNIIIDYKLYRVVQILTGGKMVAVIDDEDEDAKKMLISVDRLRKPKQEEEKMKPTPKKPVAKKPAPKKAEAKKPEAKKSTPKKSTPQKPTTKKAEVKKPAAKKPAPKKPAAKKPVPKKSDKQEFKLEISKYDYMVKTVPHNSKMEVLTYAAFPKNNKTFYYSFNVYGGMVNGNVYIDKYKKTITTNKIKNKEQRIENLKKKGYEPIK